MDQKHFDQMLHIAKGFLLNNFLSKKDSIKMREKSYEHN